MRGGAILFEDFEFSFYIQFADLMGFYLVVGAEFSLNEGCVIEGLGAEQADDKPDCFPVRLEQIIIALPHPCNCLYCTGNTDNCDLS